MKKVLPVLALFSLFCLSSFAENDLVFKIRCSRGDDDLAYTYRTAHLDVALRLKRVANKWDASITFLAELSTEEAQGFAESVRFGMREAARQYRTHSDDNWRDFTPAEEPVLFKFVRVTPQGLVADEATQRVAETLSNNALRTGQAVPGNRSEAKNKVIGGTLALGELEEGQHQGTLFVQQLVGQQPSQTDADISVRHLVKWNVTVKDGKVSVSVRNGKYDASDAAVNVVAPSWDGTIRPHRVVLLSRSVEVDGKSFPSATSPQNASHQEKAAVLMSQDRDEFRREYSLKERIQKRRELRK